MITSKEIEAQLPPVLYEMETTGFLLNTEVLEKRIAYFKKHKENLRSELITEFSKVTLRSVVGFLDLGLELIDYDDDKEVIATLNRIPGVTVTSRSKVKLRDLAEEKPEVAKICELLIEMNHCDAMIYNHGECWRTKAVNGYLYPKHKLERTDTGRLASDFQQWQRPEHIPDVPELREILTPRSGMTFVYTDFSQIEVRIAAQESKDPWLLGILNSGEDVHARIIADTLCKVPQDFLNAYNDPKDPMHQKAVDVRSKHKGATFNILYGATAHGMLTRQRLQHQPHVVHSDHRTRLLEFILQLGLAEHLSTFAAEWGSRSIAEIRLPDKTRLRFWADPCTASIRMQVLGTEDSSAIGVSLFDLTNSEVEKIRREIERKINKALPKPTRILKKGTK